MPKAEVAEMPRKVSSFTAEDVDRFAVKVAKHDKEGDEIDAIKKQLRKSIGEGNHLDGEAFRISISDAPAKYEKVDYRALALKYMKEAGVDGPAKLMRKLEEEASSEPSDYGTPRVTIEPNPNYKP